MHPVTGDCREALSRAESMLSSELGLYRLDNVWGIGGGLRPVKTLIRQMNLLLEEYLSSGDAQEATRCLVALEVPHFYHELVYEVCKHGCNINLNLTFRYWQNYGLKHLRRKGDW